MQVLKFEDREAWLLARRGKITGSKLKDIVVKRGTGKKIGFYELIAERIGLPATEEPSMDRGTRLEEEAVARFCKETKKECDPSLVIWTRDENDSIAISPDASIIGENAAVEAKCLSSARHIEAWHTKEIPDEYKMQAIQYFIVNDLLEKLYVVFFDPRIPPIDYFVIEITRPEVEAEVKEYLEYQRKTLEEVNEIVNKLTY